MKQKKKENILVFCAHIDDHIFGPGATLAQYAKEGKNIYVCIFSYSEASLAWLKKKIALKTVINEIKDANQIIGVKKVFAFGLHDRKIEQEVKEKKIIPKLKKLISRYKPTKIFTHSSMDPHADHRAVNKAVLEAVDKSRLKCDVFAFEEIWSPIRFGKRNLPKMYIDVSDTFHKKIEAIKAFKSQKVTIWTLIWNVYAKAFMHGKYIHTKWAEKFYKLR